MGSRLAAHDAKADIRTLPTDGRKERHRRCESLGTPDREGAQKVGMVILLALMVFVFGNDILKLFGI